VSVSGIICRYVVSVSNVGAGQNRRPVQRCRHLKLIAMHVVAAPDFEITFGLYSFEFSSSPLALLQAYPVAFTKASDTLSAVH